MYYNSFIFTPMYLKPPTHPSHLNGSWARSHTVLISIGKFGHAFDHVLSKMTVKHIRKFSYAYGHVLSKRTVKHILTFFNERVAQKEGGKMLWKHMP